MQLKPIIGSQQAEAKKTHDLTTTLEKRRESLLKARFPFKVTEKSYDVPVVSERLRAQGRLDMLAITDSGERIPVEFKVMSSNRGRVHLDHKYQLTVLALFVEDVFNVVVRRGIVHYHEDELTILIPLTQQIKQRTEKLLQEIRAMIESGTKPSGRLQCSRNKVGCGFADRCGDFF